MIGPIPAGAELIYLAIVQAIETDRLTVRAAVESDRARFVELFTDEAFTVFSDGVHDVESANARFDRMLSLVDLVPYAKQPVVVRASGTIVGYTGVGTVSIEGLDRLEWGWRLAPAARGQGYATEATTALIARADSHRRHTDGGKSGCGRGLPEQSGTCPRPASRALRT